MTPPLPTPLDREAIARLLDKHNRMYPNDTLSDVEVDWLVRQCTQLLAALDEQERENAKLREALT